MKQISFFAIIILIAFLANCGARQEKKNENTDSLVKIVDTDSSNLTVYDDFKSEDDSDSSLTAKKDSTKLTSVKEKTTVSKEKTKVSKEKTTVSKEKPVVTKEKLTTNKKSNEVKVLVESKDGTLKKPSTTTEKKEIITNHKRYYVVGGSYNKVENAKARDNMFKSKGFKTQILPKSQKGKYYYIALASVNSKADAQKELKRAQAKFKDIKFWILIR